jgi:2-haloacid dehalogenase
MPTPAPKALVFDVFGTCVDWRGSIIAEGRTLSARWGIGIDWTAFADAWRGRYQPALQEVRSGRRPWTILDVLHRESLDALAAAFGLDKLDEAERDHLNRIWHRLNAWPDTVTGLTRLKRRFVIGPLSNGNFALLTNMAKHAGLPWDVNLSCELYRAYKPDPATYLGAAGLLGLRPAETMMVAAHYSDLQAARGCGLLTAYVHRPREFGDTPKPDLPADPQVDLVVDDFEELASRLGC